MSTPRRRRCPRGPFGQPLPCGRQVALLVATLLAVAPAVARAGEDPDPWFGRDKALHFSFSAALAGGGYAAVSGLADDRGWRVLGGAALALSAGVAKELYDRSGNGDASARDLAWDVVGTATGLLLALAVDYWWTSWARRRLATS